MAEDSFFGFGTSQPSDERGPRGDDEEEELEYDALNDETFGAAVNGDWEDLHENLVQFDRRANDEDDDEDDLDGNVAGRGSGNARGSQQHSNDALRNDFHDLERDLMRLGLQSMPGAHNDDGEGRIQLDPSVWAPPPTTTSSQGGRDTNLGSMFAGLQPARQQPAFHQHHHHQPPQPSLPPFMMSAGPKMCTLEDIERSMRSPSSTTAAIQQQQQHPSNQNNGLRSLMENNSANMFNNNNMFPGPPSNSGSGGGGGGGPLNAPSRLPPGFGPQPPPGPPLHGNNFGHPQPPPPFGMPNHRPGYPPMMGGGGPPMPPNGPPPPPHGFGPQGPQSPNQYNKRLVMEIQQTHPLLCYNRMNPGMPPPMHPMFMQQPGGPMPPMMPHPQGPPPPMGHPMAGLPMMLNGGKGGPHPQQQRGFSPLGGARDGNLSLQRQLNGTLEPEELRDEYRNLMTPRDKQWLIGIQLLQLNTETPYIDDYYYTVYKERQMRGRRDNRSYKDNQLNHPLTQSQGHAQLVLQSIGNRNYNNSNKGFAGSLNNSRDGRKNSESGGRANGNDKGGDQQQQQTTPRTYTPLQFENSLGKLQCGSVTAPRKIIDMEIMAAEANSAQPAMEVTAQRRTRQLLWHIETLYRVVLKLEDLKNPTAIEAAALLKEKRERERKAALEQQLAAERDAAAAANTQDGAASGTSKAAPAGGGRLNIDTAAALEEKNKVDTCEELLETLEAGLPIEKVLPMMSVRKGRTLLQRALAQMEEASDLWAVWLTVLVAIPMAVKKEREEAEAQLFSFAPVLKRHLAKATLDHLLCLATGISGKGAAVLSTKFGIVATILLVNRAEELFAGAKDTINMKERREWNGQLSILCMAADVVTKAAADKEKQAAEKPTVKQLMHLEKVIAHLLRFPDLESSQMLLKVLSRHAMEELL